MGHGSELAASGVDLGTLRSDAAKHGEALARHGGAMIDEWLDGLRPQRQSAFRSGSERNMCPARAGWWPASWRRYVAEVTRWPRPTAPVSGKRISGGPENGPH